MNNAPNGLSWRKSNRSMANGACVEVAFGTGSDKTVYVRDSKNRTGAVLSYGQESWSSFIATLKDQH